MQHVVALLAFAIAGCGFRNLQSGEGDLAASDLAGIDLAGADLTGVTIDMTVAIGGSGRGPFGALPAGFCCSSADVCRNRQCVSGHCTDECFGASDCMGWSSGLTCDVATARCVPVDATTFTCLDPSTFHYGSKPTGTCCAHGFKTAGADCVGGVCQSTGNGANPFYCTQGCSGNTTCPTGYSCIGSLCWISQSFTDPNYIYACN